LGHAGLKKKHSRHVTTAYTKHVRRMAKKKI
jgi:hypothetical protein